MANHKGSEGTVKIGANIVAEIKSWTIEESMDTMEDTTMGDTARTFQSGLKQWSGGLECFWDETDVSGQGALVIGASVALNLYPEGAVSGDTYYAGTALVTGITRQAALDGYVEVSFSFQGTGALAESTVI